jgi:hypothetical protein
MYLSFRRARRFTAPRRMPQFRRAFHSPRIVCEAAIARVAVQLRQLEEVLISGASAAWPEQLLLDDSSNPRGRAVAKVLGSLCDRERPWRAHRARHRRTSNAATSWWVFASRRGSSPPLDDLAPPIPRAVLRPVPSCVSRFQPKHSISLVMITTENWCNDQSMTVVPAWCASSAVGLLAWRGPRRGGRRGRSAPSVAVLSLSSAGASALCVRSDARDLSAYDNRYHKAVRN